MKIVKNPFLLFSPFLAIYCIYIVTFSEAVVVDGDRYIDLAHNLLNGFYSPPAPDIDLWWGPGYPILLVPFVALGLPLVAMTLANAVFQYLSVVYLFKTLMKFVSFRFSLGVSLFWALCFSAYSEMAIIHTEAFSTFLVSLLIYFVATYFSTRQRRYILFAGLALGYLALTKVIFGYVILSLLLICLLLWMLDRTNVNLKSACYFLLIAQAITLPYLLYTYTLTNRVFYWGNSGGMSLYWMSSPHENEYGDWNYETLQPITPIDDTPMRMELLKKTHSEDMTEILHYTGVERDDAYKRIALRNIRSNPIKFCKNIFSNASRLFFEFPFTYSFQRPQLKVFYFSIVFVLSLFAAILTVINWGKIEFSIRLLLSIGVIYLGGSLLLSMYNRMLLIVMPLLLLWIAYVLSKSLILKFKF